MIPEFAALTPGSIPSRLRRWNECGERAIPEFAALAPGSNPSRLRRWNESGQSSDQPHSRLRRTAMPDEWMVRVDGREYGPVDADELLEWKAEGWLIPANEVRRADDDRWFPAGELPEIFGEQISAEPPDLV